MIFARLVSIWRNVTINDRGAFDRCRWPISRLVVASLVMSVLLQRTRRMKSALFPSSPFALRLAAIMHRQPTTPWNEKKEISHFRKLAKHIHEEDLQLVERYYKSNWPPTTGKNHLRHDLATLINNWSGEVDRARIWCEAHPIKIVRKIIPIELPSEGPPLSDEDQADSERFLAQYRLRKLAKESA